MLDRKFHTTKIIPASPKSFKSIIAEQRAAITEAFDTQARDAVQSQDQSAEVTRQSQGD